MADLGDNFLQGYFKTMEMRQNMVNRQTQASQFAQEMDLRRQEFAAKQASDAQETQYKQSLLANSLSQQKRQNDKDDLAQNLDLMKGMASGQLREATPANPMATPQILPGQAPGQIQTDQSQAMSQPPTIQIAGHNVRPATPEEMQTQNFALQMGDAKAKAAGAAAEKVQGLQDSLAWIDKNAPDSAFAKGKPGRDALAAHMLTGYVPPQEAEHSPENGYGAEIQNYMSTMFDSNKSAADKQQAKTRLDMHTRLITPYLKLKNEAALGRLGLDQGKIAGEKSDFDEVLQEAQARLRPGASNEEKDTAVTMATLKVNAGRPATRKLDPAVIKKVQETVLGKNDAKNAAEDPIKQMMADELKKSLNK